ncbi:MAG TPA: hypothetical protein PK231_12855 [Acidocella sp.]|nr:hypothetical protein [Acidocella sp.]
MVPKHGTAHDDVSIGLRGIGVERRGVIAYIAATETVPVEGIFYGGQTITLAI